MRVVSDSDWRDDPPRTSDDDLWRSAQPDAEGWGYQATEPLADPAIPDYSADRPQYGPPVAAADSAAAPPPAAPPADYSALTAAPGPPGEAAPAEAAATPDGPHEAPTRFPSPVDSSYSDAPAWPQQPPPAYPTPGSQPGAPAYPPQPGGYGPGGYPPPPAGYPPTPGYPPVTLGGPVTHPMATPAMVVGIVGLIGECLCGVFALACPVAWVLGVKARRAIAAAPGQYAGHQQATVGMVTGIIGTVLAGAALLFIVFVYFFGDGIETLFAN